MHVIERAQGRYDVEDVEFGRVYKWQPTSVLVECECGQRLSLTSSMTNCECGMDHTADIREELSGQPLEEAVRYPWRYWHSSEDTEIPF
ncbi:MAG: hypothetical protein JOZ19_10550 [Rubrobacter sp.]|nr:hypothetical protein [Rubrobacter sp.]